jgi:hypothetical protein
VRDDRVAEGVPAPRGKGFEIRGLGGNSPMNSNDLRSGKTLVQKIVPKRDKGKHEGSGIEAA